MTRLHTFLKTLFVLCLLGIMSLAFTACGIGGGAGEQDIEARAQGILDSMSLQEKVDQLSGGPYIEGDWFAGMSQIDNDRLNVPSMIYRDGPRGARKVNDNIRGTTTFPVAASRASTWDLELEEKIGKVMGVETRALGAYTLLAPTINQVMHPRWGRAQETYGEDSFLLGKMGTAFVKGVQTKPEEDTYTVQSCVKHFAANNTENNRATFNALLDERTLREVYLPHFKMTIDEGDAAAFMGAYNMVNGEFNCNNYNLIREILKTEWGFEGYIITDWYAYGSTVDSLTAGLDVEMPFSDGAIPGDHIYIYGPTLVTAINSNMVSEDLLDEAVLRILKRKIEYGVLDYEPSVNDRNIETDEHISIALEAAQKGTVLLKNDGTLPISDRNATVVTVGEFANAIRLGDKGSSNCAPSYSIDPTEGLEALLGKSITTYSQISSFDAAKISAADYVVIVTAYRPADLSGSIAGTDSWGEEGEAKDRNSLALADRDLDNINNVKQIIADNSLTTKIIVVIESGGAVVMPWIDGVSAVLMAWYPGMEGGTAIAQIIYGDVNPSGKICQTFPSQANIDAGYFVDFPNQVPSANIPYYHGYRYLDKENEKAPVVPLYYFGYGLSYTTYEYTNISVSSAAISESDTITVSVDVENTGSVAGEEIVQLYIGYDNTSVADGIGRPVKELKGFKRIALTAGEKKTVELEVKASDLRYYNPTTKEWQVEKMVHQVYAGPSADPTKLLSATFEIK